LRTLVRIRRWLSSAAKVLDARWAKQRVQAPTVQLRKRDINNFLDYSGALYFSWARRHLELKRGILFHAVKETNVLSSGGRKVTMLGRGQILSTFGIRLVRCVTKLLPEFAIWCFSGARSSVAGRLQRIALRVSVTRLPLVPNKDLLFVGVGIAAAGVMDVSQPKVGAALVLMAALGMVKNIPFGGRPWFLEQFQFRRRIGPIASVAHPVQFAVRHAGRGACILNTASS